MGWNCGRKLISEKNLTLDEAREVVISHRYSPTHTPVPAGNDVFPMDMMDRYFETTGTNCGCSAMSF
jgi:starch phosphorylase